MSAPSASAAWLFGTNISHNGNANAGKKITFSSIFTNLVNPNAALVSSHPVVITLNSAGAFSNRFEADCYQVTSELFRDRFTLCVPTNELVYHWLDLVNSNLTAVTAIPGQPVRAIATNGVSVGSQPTLNIFAASTNVTITATNNTASNRVDVAINASASGSGVSDATLVTASNALYLQITNINTITSNALASGIVRVDWFGAVGNGVTEDLPAIQSAINFARSNNVGSVIFTSGKTYAISNSVLVGNTNASGTWLAVASLTLRGDSEDATDTQTPTIQVTSSNAPAIVIQLGQDITVKGLTILGKNSFSIANTDQLYDGTNFLVNASNIRTNRWSPYAGIVFDAFDNGITGTDRYPGQEGRYTGGVSGGSARCSIKGCFIRYFYVGVMENCSGQIANGEGIKIENTSIYNCWAAVATGQDQSRDCAVKDSQIGFCYKGFTAVDFGGQYGASPNFDGGEMVYVRFAFRPETSRGTFSARGMYFEAITSLGIFGTGGSQNPVLFADCAAAFDNGTNTAASQLYLSHSGLRFDGGKLTTYAGKPFVIYVANNSDTRAVFNNTIFSAYGTAATPEFLGGLVCSYWPMVDFNNCKLQGTNGSFKTFSSNVRATGMDDYLLNGMFTPGGRIETDNQGEFVLSKPYYIALYTYNFNTNTIHTGYGTFVVSSNIAATLAVGDRVVTDGNAVNVPADEPSGAGVHNYVGTITNITGTNVFYSAVVRGATNLYAGAVQIIPRYHQPTVGITTNGSTMIGLFSPVAAWAVGDRIRGAGISEGSSITAISGSNVTISVAASASGTTHLYDAMISRPVIGQASNDFRLVDFNGNNIVTNSTGIDAMGNVVSTDFLTNWANSVSNLVQTKQHGSAALTNLSGNPFVAYTNIPVTTSTTVSGAGSGSTNYLLTLSSIVGSINSFNLGSSNVHIYTVTGGTYGSPIAWRAAVTNLSANTWGINFASGTNRWRFSGVYGTNAPSVLTNGTALWLAGESDGTNTVVGYTYFAPGL